MNFVQFPSFEYLLIKSVGIGVVMIILCIVNKKIGLNFRKYVCIFFVNYLVPTRMEHYFKNKGLNAMVVLGL
jgi:hypothetical protein